jgi:hypothetical protein
MTESGAARPGDSQGRNLLDEKPREISSPRLSPVDGVLSMKREDYELEIDVCSRGTEGSKSGFLHHARFELASGCTFDLWADDVPTARPHRQRSESLRTLRWRKPDSKPWSQRRAWVRTVEEIDEFVRSNKPAMLYFSRGRLIQRKSIKSSMPG